MKIHFRDKTVKDKTIIEYMDGTKGVFKKSYIDQYQFDIIESKRTGQGLEELNKIFIEGEING